MGIRGFFLCADLASRPPKRASRRREAGGNLISLSPYIPSIPFLLLCAFSAFSAASAVNRLGPSGLDRGVVAGAPLGPGAVVDRGLPVAQEIKAQGQDCGGDAGTAGGHHRPVGGHAGVAKSPRQRLGRQQGSGRGIEEIGVGEVDRAGNMPAAQTGARFRVPGLKAAGGTDVVVTSISQIVP